MFPKHEINEETGKAPEPPQNGSSSEETEDNAGGKKLEDSRNTHL